MFPIFQSPPNVAQIFWICQLHTAWQLLHDNGGSEHPAVSWGWIIWKWQQRTTTRLLGAHCHHSPSAVARQCEADMSGKSVPHQEETGEFEDLANQSFTYKALNPISSPLPPPLKTVIPPADFWSLRKSVTLWNFEKMKKKKTHTHTHKWQTWLVKKHRKSCEKLPWEWSVVKVSRCDKTQKLKLWEKKKT